MGLGQDDDSDGEEQYDLGQVLGPLESILPGLLGGGLGGVGQARGFPGPIRVRQGPSQRIRISRGPPQPPHRVGPQGPHNLGMDQAALENALQDFVFNLAGMQFGGAGAGGAAGGGGAPGGARFHFIGRVCVSHTSHHHHDHLQVPELSCTVTPGTTPGAGVDWTPSSHSSSTRWTGRGRPRWPRRTFSKFLQLKLLRR